MNTLSIEIKEQADVSHLSLKKIFNVVSVWRARSVMRHKLAQLPEYRLEDMGISAEQAFAESQKPFWER